MRERREWEDRLARKAVLESLELDDGMDESDRESDCGDWAEEQLSPTEEREIEELLSYLPHDYIINKVDVDQSGGFGLGRDETRQLFQIDSQARGSTCVGDMSDDEDYDQLFMEMDVGGFDVATGTATCVDKGLENSRAITLEAQSDGTSHGQQSGSSMDVGMDTMDMS
jgi:hypothetical protein